MCDCATVCVWLCHGVYVCVWLCHGVCVCDIVLIAVCDTLIVLQVCNLNFITILWWSHNCSITMVKVSFFCWWCCVCCIVLLTLCIILWVHHDHNKIAPCGMGIAQWLECRTCDWKVTGSNPCRSSGRIIFSRVVFQCWILFWYPFHPRVTAVACKKSWSFCQKRRWQVTPKHAYKLRMWLCMKWHGAWLYGVHRTWAETAAVSCGTSHASAVSTPLQWIFNKRKKCRIKS